MRGDGASGADAAALLLARSVAVDCDTSQDCHYCGHDETEHGLDGACFCDVLRLTGEWSRCSCAEYAPRRCRDCFCVADDHNNTEAGGGCTACGDCEGWL